MHPHPRIRKTIKWGGLALTVWCGVVWIVAPRDAGGLWFGITAQPWRTWLSHVPLWTPTLLLAIATAAAWRLDTLARRRALGGVCPTCRYDRTGLASADAPCPECGSSPPRHP